MVQQRLPLVNGDDGAWGDILNQYITKEHYNTGVDDAANGGHKTVTLRPGTTTAATAPLKFTSGPLLTNPEAGAVEFLNDSYYATITAGPNTRKTIAFSEDVLKLNQSSQQTTSGTFKLAALSISTPAFISGEKFSRSFVISNPTVSADLPLWRAPVDCTITAVHLLCKGAAITGQLWEFDANGLNGATLDGTDVTGIVDTNVDDTSFSNPGIAAGYYVGWKTTTASAGTTYAIVNFEGYYN